MPDNGNDSGNQGSGTGAGETPASWDEALAGMPETVRALYEGHITGLKNTVASTRQERDALSGSLKAIEKALGTDPAEAKRLLDEMTSNLAQAERRAAFFEDAARPEVGCTNARLAFVLAETEGLFNKQGAPNWEAIKTAAPELFRKAGAQGSADGGAGAGKTAHGGKSMNDFIRAAAGR